MSATETEQEAIASFCQAERDIRDCVEQCQAQKRPLTDQKREHLAALDRALDVAKRQSVCVEIDGQSWQVGRKNSRYLKRITEAVVSRSLGNLEVDAVGHARTLDELAAQVLKLIQDERSVKRTYISVQKAAPTKQCTPVSNRAAIVQCISKHQECKQALAAINATRQAQVKQLRSKNESEGVLGYLERTQQSYQPITMKDSAGQDVRYNIKRQVKSKVVNLRKEALLHLVQRAVGKVLDVDDDEDNLPDITEDHVARLVQNREELARQIMAYVREEPKQEEVVVSLCRTRGPTQKSAKAATEHEDEQGGEEEEDM